MLNSDVDFNPRLREGGDGFYWSKHCKRCLISIHASAKEATFEHLLYVLDEHIFQSTPPRRRRHCIYSWAPLILLISIHASAKEATPRGCCITIAVEFQSTPPRRRRPQHIVIPQLSCTYLVSTTFLSTFFSFISQYVVLFFLF